MLVAVAATTLMTSCIKDKFDTPELTPDEDPNLAVTHTIAQVKDLYSTEPVLIQEDIIIQGVVISDDEAGNVYQTLVIQDETGGISFRIRRTDLFTDFPFGRKVYVKMNGLTIGAYRNLIQVGQGDDGQGGVNPIEQAFVDDFFVKGPRNQVVTPKVVSISELNNSYQNTLIKLVDVQFKSANAGKNTYSDAVKKQYGNYDLEDCNGKYVVVRTSGYAKFGADTLPTGKGSVVAIYQVFGTTGQLLLNKVSDVDLTGARCDGGVIDPGEPGDTTAPATPGASAKLLFVGADFEDWTTFTGNLDLPIRNYATQATGAGFNGGNALKLTTEVATLNGQNQAVFTPKATPEFKLTEGATKISFYVKGTAGKSFSLNVFKNDNSFYIFNVGDLTTNKIVSAATGNASYTGKVNTNNEWVLVTLDLTGLSDLRTTDSENVFALRIGHSEPYDILIDNIVVW